MRTVFLESDMAMDNFFFKYNFLEQLVIQLLIKEKD